MSATAICINSAELFITVPRENLLAKVIKVSISCCGLTVWTISKMNVAQNMLVSPLFWSLYYPEVNLTPK